MTLCFINHQQKPVKVVIEEQYAQEVLDKLFDRFNAMGNIRYVGEDDLHFTDPVEHKIIERSTLEFLGTLTCDKEIVFLDLYS